MNIESIRRLAEKTNGDTRLLYHLDWYDGLISGVVLWRGHRQYFSLVDELIEESKMSDEDWEKYCLAMKRKGVKTSEVERYDIDFTRIFAVYDTPNESMEILDENHLLFQQYVGTHCDYEYPPSGVCKIGPGLHPLIESNHNKFYKAKKRDPNLDLDNWKIIGKFV